MTLPPCPAPPRSRLALPWCAISAHTPRPRLFCAASRSEVMLLCQWGWACPRSQWGKGDACGPRTHKHKHVAHPTRNTQQWSLTWSTGAATPTNDRHSPSTAYIPRLVRQLPHEIEILHLKETQHRHKDAFPVWRGSGSDWPLQVRAQIRASENMLRENFARKSMQLFSTPGEGGSGNAQDQYGSVKR